MFSQLFANTVFNTALAHSSPSNHQKHTFTHTKNIAEQAIDYKHINYTTSIKNPRIGGSIPPPGHHFYQRKQWFRSSPNALCVCKSKTHQTHTFCRVFRLEREWNRCVEHCVRACEVGTQCWLLCCGHSVGRVLGQQSRRHRLPLYVVGTEATQHCVPRINFWREAVASSC